MLVRWIFLSFTAVALAVCSRAQELDWSRYETVTVAPTKTSIYVGSVSLTIPSFHRTEGKYSSSYVAKVFPYFFSNEKGRLWIEFSDEQLRQLARGERVHFTGGAENTEGDSRRIEGHATPTDAHSGKIKVRVFVAKETQLIFNTTYRFEERRDARGFAEAGAEVAPTPSETQSPSRP